MKRSHWLLLFFIALLIFPAVAHAQQPWSGILDPTRATNYSAMGAGTIPSGAWTQVGSTIAAYSGTTDTINNALANCNGTGQYVLLGPGIFTLSRGGTTSNGIKISRNRCVLRGSGPIQTKLVAQAGATEGCGGENGFICFFGNTAADPAGPQNIASVTGGLSQGSTSITIGPNTAGGTKIVVGQTIVLDLGMDSTVRSA